MITDEQIESVFSENSYSMPGNCLTEIIYRDDFKDAAREIERIVRDEMEASQAESVTRAVEARDAEIKAKLQAYLDKNVEQYKAHPSYGTRDICWGIKFAYMELFPAPKGGNNDAHL